MMLVVINGKRDPLMVNIPFNYDYFIINSFSYFYILFRFTDIVKNVGDLELNLITQCIQFQNFLGKLEVGCNPPITFVFVQKRHQTRLFPRNPHDEIFQLINNGIQIIIPFQMQIGKGKNVPPGTVVDTAIVHPTKNDFFFVSHLGITVNFRCIIQRK